MIAQGRQLMIPHNYIVGFTRIRSSEFIYDNSFSESRFKDPDDNDDCYNILRCIKIQAEKLGYSVQTTIKMSMFEDWNGDPVDATIVEII